MYTLYAVHMMQVYMQVYINADADDWLVSARPIMMCEFNLNICPHMSSLGEG